MPIWINDYSGKSHEVPLDLGDMVVYHGTELEHWRDKFEGETVSTSYALWIQRVSLRIEFMMADLILD